MDDERLDEERPDGELPEEEKRLPWWVYGLMLLFLAVVIWLVDAVFYFLIPRS